mgnify:FL=1
MDPENVLVLTIFITIIIGIFIVLIMVLIDDHDQNNETYDKKQKTYDERLKDRINFEKQELINKLNGKIKNIERGEYTPAFIDSNLLFVNKDDIFDIKLPYHFVSSTKSFNNNQSYLLDESSQNYIALYLQNDNITFVEKSPSVIDNFNRSNNFYYKNYLTMNNYNYLYDQELTHQITNRSLFRYSYKVMNDDDVIKNIADQFKQFMNENNLNVEDLSQFFKDQNKKIQLDDQELNQFLNDYDSQIKELKNQQYQKNLKRFNQFKDSIKSVSANAKDSYFYEELTTLLNNKS